MKEPFDPQDPLWKLLGQGREVEVRSNFVQNVVRQARQTPQERSLLARWCAWFSFKEGEKAVLMGRLAVVAAVLLVGTLTVVQTLTQPEESDSNARVVAERVSQLVEPVLEKPLVPEVETQLETLDYLDALLALEDTSGLSDREIAYLLY